MRQDLNEHRTENNQSVRFWSFQVKSYENPENKTKQKNKHFLPVRTSRGFPPVPPRNFLIRAQVTFFFCFSTLSPDIPSSSGRTRSCPGAWRAEPARKRSPKRRNVNKMRRKTHARERGGGSIADKTARRKTRPTPARLLLADCLASRLAGGQRGRGNYPRQGRPFIRHLGAGRRWSPGRNERGKRGNRILNYAPALVGMVFAL